MRKIHLHLPHHGAESTYQNIDYSEYIKSINRVQSTIEYIQALLTNHSKLLAVRTDLYFQKHHPDFILINSDTAIQCLKNFLNNRRSNCIFKHLVGYVIRLEYGNDRGWHFHCLFLLNGNLAQNGYYYGREFGEYWVKTVSRFYSDHQNLDGYQVSLGDYHNCNHGDYLYDGIGVIAYYDEMKIRNLFWHVIPYLAKPDSDYVERTTPRAFWRGIMPIQRSVRLGRPREIEPSQFLLI